MFTGIVEELGHVERVEHAGASARLTVHAPRAMEGTRPGDSICVNGCCLTVAEPHDDAFTADLMAETLERTGLGELAVGSPVNLERRCAHRPYGRAHRPGPRRTPQHRSWSVATRNTGTCCASRCPRT